nr:MAG TPA: hypothetical protein [Caudoviricetes sp.]
MKREKASVDWLQKPIFRRFDGFAEVPGLFTLSI